MYHKMIYLKLLIVYLYNGSDVRPFNTINTNFDEKYFVCNSSSMCSDQFIGNKLNFLDSMSKTARSLQSVIIVILKLLIYLFCIYFIQYDLKKKKIQTYNKFNLTIIKSI